MYHDLQKILDAVSVCYFDGILDLKIQWKRAQPMRAKARQTMNLAHYMYPDRTITVHPALNQSWVPQYVMTYLIFHEALHSIFLPEVYCSTGHVKNFHTPEFLAAEKRFAHFERAVAWLDRTHKRLLRTPARRPEIA